MAIVDNTSDIRQELHKIKFDEAAFAVGVTLDVIGAEYSTGRLPGEPDDVYRARIVRVINKVMSDAAATKAESQRYHSVRFVHLTVRQPARVTAAL